MVRHDNEGMYVHSLLLALSLQNLNEEQSVRFQLKQTTASRRDERQKIRSKLLWGKTHAGSIQEVPRAKALAHAEAISVA